MKKVIVILYILILLFTNSLNIVEAQNDDAPSVCFVSPDETQDFIDSITDFLVWFDMPDWETYSRNTLAAPIWTIASIMSTIWWSFANVGMNFASTIRMMNWEEEIFRDYRKVYQLKSSVDDFFNDIWFSIIAFNNVDEEEIGRFNEIFANEDNFLQYEITDEINYIAYGSILYDYYFVWKSIFLDAAMWRENPRAFIWSDRVWNEDKKPNRVDKVDIDINYDNYQYLKNSYDALDRCPKQSGFSESMNNLRNNFKDDSADALGRISKDWWRLSEASKSSRDAASWEWALSLDRYWNLETDLSDLDGLENPFSTEKNLPDDCYERVNEWTQMRRERKDECFDGLESPDDSVVENKIKENFTSNVASVFEFIWESEKSQLTDLNKDIQYSKNITNNITTLSRNVHNAINIIWDEWESNTIVDNLGNACESQCGNLWWVCWYF